MTSAGVIVATGFDGSNDLVYQVEIDDELATNYTFSVQVSYPTSGNLSFAPNVQTSSTLVQFDWTAMADLYDDLQNQGLQEGTASTSVDIAARLPPSGSPAAVVSRGAAGLLTLASIPPTVASSVANCLWYNKDCFLGVAGVGLSLIKLGATCSAAGVDAVALVASILVTVLAPEIGVGELGDAETGAALPELAGACADQYAATLATVSDGVGQAGAQCTTNLVKCFTPFL